MSNLSVTVTDSEDLAALEMVRLGYALDDPSDARRVLTFRARFNTLEGAVAAVETIEEYNGFEAARVVPALKQVSERAKYARFQVGREHSPVIYVEGLWDLNSAEREHIADIMAKAGADEHDIMGDTVRAWWD